MNTIDNKDYNFDPNSIKIVVKSRKDNKGVD